MHRQLINTSGTLGLRGRASRTRRTASMAEKWKKVERGKGKGLPVKKTTKPEQQNTNLPVAEFAGLPWPVMWHVMHMNNQSDIL